LSETPTTKLDQFANDFQTYLNEIYRTNDIRDWNVKVIIISSQTWTTVVPEGLRNQFKNIDDRCRDLMVIYGRSKRNWVKVSEAERKFAMRRCGFAPELVEALSPYDVLLFINIDYSVPLLVQVGHLLVHVQEAVQTRTIIKEEGSSHNFNDPVTTTLLSRFVECLGEEEFLRRYVPMKNLEERFRLR
jgi:hypothetical protein